MSRNRESYKNDTFGMPQRRGERSFWGVLLMILFLALSISLCVALIVAYLTPYVSPSTFGSFTIVGIFAPILYIMVVICMMVWVLVQRWGIVLALFVVLMPGLFRLSDFYNINIHREVELPNDKRAFTVMSYNVRGFRNDDNKFNAGEFVDHMLSKERMPDVVCLQECALAAHNFDRVDSLFSKYNVADATEYKGVVLRTYSRHPIINSGAISGDGRGTSQWCDILVGDRLSSKKDTVRIFNNHLYTMSISAADSDDINDGRILRDGDRMASIVDRIADNSAVRADHVDSLRTVIDNTPYEIVVCGDFNDTPMSYVYRRLSRNMYDSFVLGGRGYGYTFRPMHKTLRIDYILHSEGMETQMYSVDEQMEMSDHLPVLARVKVLPEN